VAAIIHNKHRRHQAWHTWGLQKQSKLNVVDNSALGRQAMAEGRPPKVIHCYSKKHDRRRQGAYAKLGDRVMVAIMGQKKKGIVVGLKQKQKAFVPRMDSNNLVLIEENGNPSGNRITAPLPNVIRPGLMKDSNPKRADYTKLFAIATKWV
jgi:large subunit ribosomal protein L14